MQNFINLEAFRKHNHITQEKIAQYLGTTRGYISLVESGRSKLSDEKIDKLMGEGRLEEGWNVYPLNPAFYNLYTLSEYLRSMDDKLSPAFDWESGQNPLMIQPLELLEIKHGKKDITPKIANTIVQRYPYVNRDWVMSGNGDWLLTEAQQTIRKEINSNETVLTLEERIAALDRRFCEMMEKIDRIERLVSGITK